MWSPQWITTIVGGRVIKGKKGDHLIRRVLLKDLRVVQILALRFSRIGTKFASSIQGLHNLDDFHIWARVNSQKSNVWEGFMTRWARSIHSMLRDSLAISENFSIAMCMCCLTIYICSLDTIIKTCVCAHTSHSPKHMRANFQQQLPSLRAV